MAFAARAFPVHQGQVLHLVDAHVAEHRQTLLLHVSVIRRGLFFENAVTGFFVTRWLVPVGAVFIVRHIDSCLMFLHKERRSFHVRSSARTASTGKARGPLNLFNWGCEKNWQTQPCDAQTPQFAGYHRYDSHNFFCLITPLSRLKEQCSE